MNKYFLGIRPIICSFLKLLGDSNDQFKEALAYAKAQCQGTQGIHKTTLNLGCESQAAWD